MYKFINKKALFKANKSEANTLNVTALGDFYKSNKIIFKIEAINNPLFDAKYISVELVEDKIVILTVRGNPTIPTETDLCKGKYTNSLLNDRRMDQTSARKTGTIV